MCRLDEDAVGDLENDVAAVLENDVVFHVHRVALDDVKNHVAS